MVCACILVVCQGFIFPIATVGEKKEKPGRKKGDSKVPMSQKKVDTRFMFTSVNKSNVQRPNSMLLLKWLQHCYKN